MITVSAKREKIHKSERKHQTLRKNTIIFRKKKSPFQIQEAGEDVASTVESLSQTKVKLDPQNKIFPAKELQQTFMYDKIIKVKDSSLQLDVF